MKSFTTLLLIFFFPSFLFAEPLSDILEKAQTIVPSERSQLVEYIDRISHVVAEERMKILVHLFKRDNGLFRRVVFAYLRKSAYPLDESWAFIRKFACGFFSDACDPYFTERVFQALERSSSLTDEMVYVRAANAESLDPQKSIMLYRQLMERQMHTPYKEECLNRLSVLALQSGTYGELTRWCTRQGIDLSLYIPEADGYAQTISAQGRICLTPHRVSIKQRVLFDASCTGKTEMDNQPSRYQWDIAGISVETGQPMIEHAFFQPGFHPIVMDRISLIGDRESFLCLVPVYGLEISLSDAQRVPARMPVEARIRFTPYLPSALAEVRWEISGATHQTAWGMTQRLFFSEPGTYKVRILIRIGLYTTQKEVIVYAQ